LVLAEVLAVVLAVAEVLAVVLAVAVQLVAQVLEQAQYLHRVLHRDPTFRRHGALFRNKLLAGFWQYHRRLGNGWHLIVSLFLNLHFR
jgi:hypothetical protein